MIAGVDGLEARECFVGDVAARRKFRLAVDARVVAAPKGRKVPKQSPSKERLFANPRAAYLHVHFAAPGCYAAQVQRA